MTAPDERLLLLIGRVYDAAVERDSWDAVVAAIVTEFRSNAANLMAEDLASTTLTRYASLAGVSEEAVRDFSEYYVHHDILAAAGARNGPGIIGTDQTLVPADVYRKSVLLNEYMVPYGYGHTMGAVLATDGSTAMMFGLQRSLAIGPYSEDEVRRLGVLLPHIERAWAVQTRISAAMRAKDDAEVTLEQMPFGAIGLDAHGAVVLLTGIARECVARRDGLCADGGVLRATHTSEDRVLAALIASAGGPAVGKLTGGGGCVRLSRRDGTSLFASVAHVAGDPLRRRIATLIFVHDPGREEKSIESSLSRVYGLTFAEARLAVALVRGETLRDAAERFRVSYHTVRAQLKSVLAKTDTRRQSELVALLLSGVMRGS